MSYIYLASPYSHQNKSIMEDRYKEVLAVAAYYTRRGQIVYSPIVHYHEMAVHFNLPKAFDFWKETNITFLRMAAKLYVLQIPGWETSQGVIFELNLARQLGLEVLFVEPIDFSNTTALTQKERSPSEYGHHTRYSDSSRYDEVCKICGATDAPNDNRLNQPCPGKVE